MLRLKCIFRFLDAHPKGYYFLQMLVGLMILQHVVCTCLRFWFLECEDQVPSSRKSVTSLFTYRFRASIFLKFSRIWKQNNALPPFFINKPFCFFDWHWWHEIWRKTLPFHQDSGCKKSVWQLCSFAWTFSQYNGDPATFSLAENWSSSSQKTEKIWVFHHFSD